MLGRLFPEPTSAVPDVAEVLLPALIQRFATMSGYRSRTEQSEDGHLLMTLEDGQAPSPILIFARQRRMRALLICGFEADIILSRRHFGWKLTWPKRLKWHALVTSDKAESLLRCFDASCIAQSKFGLISPKTSSTFWKAVLLIGRNWVGSRTDPHPTYGSSTKRRLSSNVDLTRHSDFETAVAQSLLIKMRLASCRFKKRICSTS